MELQTELEEFKKTLLYQRFLKDHEEAILHLDACKDATEPTADGGFKLQRFIGMTKALRESVIPYWDNLEEILAQEVTQNKPLPDE